MIERTRDDNGQYIQWRRHQNHSIRAETTASGSISSSSNNNNVALERVLKWLDNLHFITARYQMCVCLFVYWIELYDFLRKRTVSVCVCVCVPLLLLYNIRVWHHPHNGLNQPQLDFPLLLPFRILQIKRY